MKEKAVDGPETKQILELANRFRKSMDSHGFPFQFAVIKKLEQLFKRDRVWLFEVSEFPVRLADSETRIDFIVRPDGTRFFLVAECKRANPSMSDWCFVRAPFTIRSRGGNEPIMIERSIATYQPGTIPPVNFEASDSILSYSVDAFHIGIEVKNSTIKGDGASPTGAKSQIESAAGQVLRGLNGLINSSRGMMHPRRIFNERPEGELVSYFMPAIITTANLFVSNHNIASASIETGTLPNEFFHDLKSVPWLLYQYPRSDSLKHSFSETKRGGEFAEELYPQHVRTIAIINAKGVEDFFTNFHSYDERGRYERSRD